MSSRIVLPSLPNWTEQRLTAIFRATNPADFDAAFDAFVAPDAHITVNGKPLSHAQYKQRFASEKLEERAQDPAQVAFSGTVAAPATANESGGVGAVGAFYKATIFGRFFVFGGPTSSTVSASLNLVVADDMTLHAPRLPGGDFDGRRATVVNEVSVDNATPITLPHSSTKA
ncbi:hypothetical protein B0H21DRAFT_825469 [Amylocystis lapponica]|nr:hypothetical protein B0H21DRAFT_825469 [Amylocystis lapponica]